MSAGCIGRHGGTLGPGPAPNPLSPWALKPVRGARADTTSRRLPRSSCNFAGYPQRTREIPMADPTHRWYPTTLRTSGTIPPPSFAQTLPLKTRGLRPAENQLFDWHAIVWASTSRRDTSPRTWLAIAPRHGDRVRHPTHAWAVAAHVVPLASTTQCNAHCAMPTQRLGRNGAPPSFPRPGRKASPHGRQGETLTKKGGPYQLRATNDAPPLLGEPSAQIKRPPESAHTN